MYLCVFVFVFVHGVCVYVNASINVCVCVYVSGVCIVCVCLSCL